MKKAERIWPSSRGRSHRSCCSGVPYLRRTSMLPVSGAEQLQACDERRSSRVKAGALWRPPCQNLYRGGSPSPAIQKLRQFPIDGRSRGGGIGPGRLQSYLRSKGAPPHDLAERRVLLVGQAVLPRELLGQEQVPQPKIPRLTLQVAHDRRPLPPAGHPLQLLLELGFGGDASLIHEALKPHAKVAQPWRRHAGKWSKEARTVDSGCPLGPAPAAGLAAMSRIQQGFLAALRARGMVHSVTHEHMERGLAQVARPVGVYAGFDPTADGLHLGSMVQLMALRWLQRAGFRPVVLVRPAPR